MKKSKVVVESVSVTKADRVDMNVMPVETLAPGEIGRPYDYRVLTELVGINTYHRQCIEKKAMLTAGLGFQLMPKDNTESDDFKRQKEKVQKFVERHSIYAAQPFVQTLVNWAKDFEIFGIGYLEVVRNKASEIDQLHHLRARNSVLVREKISKNSDSMHVYLKQVNGKDIARFKQFGAEFPKGWTEFIPLKNYSVESDYYGVPEYMTALAAMFLDRNAVQFNIRRFGNNAVPDHVLFGSGVSMLKNEKVKTKQFFDQNYKGVDNSGKLLMIFAEDANAKFDLKAVNESVKEASFHVLRMDNRDEVIAAHGVPPRLLGIKTPGQLGDAAQTRGEMQMFRDTVIAPRQRMVEFVFNDILLPAMKCDKVKLVLNTFDISDDIEDANYYGGLVDRNIISVDEARVPLGFGPRPIAKSVDDAQKFVDLLLKARDIIGKIRW